MNNSSEKIYFKKTINNLMSVSPILNICSFIFGIYLLLGLSLESLSHIPSFELKIVVPFLSKNILGVFIYFCFILVSILLILGSFSSLSKNKNFHYFVIIGWGLIAIKFDFVILKWWPTLSIDKSVDVGFLGFNLYSFVLFFFAFLIFPIRATEKENPQINEKLTFKKFIDKIFKRNRIYPKTEIVIFICSCLISNTFIFLIIGVMILFRVNIGRILALILTGLLTIAVFPVGIVSTFFISWDEFSIGIFDYSIESNLYILSILVLSYSYWLFSLFLDENVKSIFSRYGKLKFWQLFTLRPNKTIKVNSPHGA